MIAAAGFVVVAGSFLSVAFGLVATRRRPREWVVSYIALGLGLLAYTALLGGVWPVAALVVVAVPNSVELAVRRRRRMG